jgi:LmbE family N-acetylglucosaminyl deacetylase
VLSAWTVLREGDDVEVVNVCGGIPAPGPVAYWDRITGATDSPARMEERLAEDRRALALAGIEPRNLPFLDDQYRDGRPFPAAELQAALAEPMEAAGAVHAPAGLGGHVDHVAVREAALGLAGRNGVSVFLYAEQPYATTFGWPHWVTGEEPNPYLAPELGWEQHLATASCGRDRLRPHVRDLDREETERKLTAMREYRTQFRALAAVAGIGRPEVSGWEVRWEVTAPSR